MNAGLAHHSVSASLTRAVLQAATELGLQRSELLIRCCLDEARLADPDGRIPFKSQQQLWLELQQHLPDAEPGLAIGSRLNAGHYSVLSYLLQSCSSLGEALQLAVRFQRLAGEGGRLQLDEVPTGICVSYLPLEPGHPANRARVLALLASWVNWLRSLVSNCSQLQVRLEHARPANIHEHEQCFRCQLLFDAERYGLLLPHELLAQPLLQANPGLQQVLQGHAEALLARLPGASLSSRVVSLLIRQLAHGEPDRASLAKSLNLSERTLQRRLTEEHSSYQQLLCDTRRLLAERYLSEGRLPATEIALLLGYSEPSVFFRAFRQWTGLTPGEYRARSRP